ncbi:MAG: PKD domain-containing protein [Anaerolineales bacterium]|nr:PKD domain-containing protein [Anaerolineales bacterium]
MKFRLVLLPFVLGIAFLSTVWALLADTPETAVTPILPGSSLYKQIGGYANAIAQQGDYVYLGIGSRLDVYDVQDVANPVLVAQTGMLTYPIRSLDMLGNYAVASSLYGLYIFDLNDPLLPQLVTEYPLPSRIVTDVEISGTLAFVGENRWLSPGGGGLRILDLADPLNPIQLGLYSEGNTIEDFSLYGQYAYVSSCIYSDDSSCSQFFAVVDVSNPMAPIEISNVSDVEGTSSAIYSHYLYRKVSGFTVGIYDLADPSAPSLLSLSSFIPQFLSKIQIVGDKLYAFDSRVLLVYDLNTPTDPPPYGVYDPGVPAGPQSVAVAGDTAFIAYQVGGLRIIDISQDTLPQVGMYSPFGAPIAAINVEDYVYVLDENRSLYVIDATTPENPIERARYQHVARDEMQLVGSDLFLRGWLGLEVVDVTEPLTPTRRSNYMIPNSGAMQVEGDYLFLLDSRFQTDSLKIVDVTDRDQPVLAASIGTHNYFGAGLQVVGDYAYLGEVYCCSSSSQLTILDVSNPVQPQVVASQPVSYEVGSLVYLNGYVYTGGGGVQIIDVTNPLLPMYAGRYTITNALEYEYEVTAVDGYLYVAAHTDRSQAVNVILDVSNPTAPVEVGRYLHNNGLPLPVGDDVYTYVPAYQDGLLIYLDSNTPPQVNAGANVTAVEGSEITFSGMMMGPGLLSSGIQWDFGDGETAVATLNPTHAYGDNGTFTVTLTVTNILGLSDSDTLLVTVENQVPVVAAGADVLQTINTPIAFSGVFTDTGYLDTHTITWNFGDGTTVTGTLTPTHVYPAPGEYTVSLTIVDDDGGAGSDTLQATIQEGAIMVYLPVIVRTP